MTITTSNAVTFTVAAAPTTALGTLVASMSAGTWAELTTTGLTTAVNVGGSTGNMLPYYNNGAWDPVHGKAHLVGQDHGAGAVRHVTYTESTNAWTTTFSTIGTGSGHGYNNLQCNPATGDLYWMRYSNGGLAKWPYGGSWNLSFKANPNLANITFGTCFWTGALTGIAGAQGAMVVWEPAFGQIWGLDVESATWAIDQDLAFGINPGYHNLACYSAQNNFMVFGGGDNNRKKIWRYNSDNTVTALTDAPTPGPEIGIQAGTLSEDPATGKCLVLSQNKLWEFDPTGSGTWTEQTGSRVPPAAVNTCDNTANSIAVIPISTYGVTMVVSADNGSSANCYLYKHA